MRRKYILSILILCIKLLILLNTSLNAQLFLANRNPIKLEKLKFYKGIIDDPIHINIEDIIWKSINVPHTWNNIDENLGEDYYRGEVLYYTSFSFNKEDRGKRHFIRPLIKQISNTKKQI